MQTTTDEKHHRHKFYSPTASIIQTHYQFSYH